MRTIILVVLMSVSLWGWSQVPGLIPYQGVARNGEGLPLADSTLNGRFSIRSGSIAGPIIWQEEQWVTTSNLGLFTAQLGLNVPLTSVNWAVATKYLQIELNTGQGFVDLGTTQLLSVPYALHSGSVKLRVSSLGDTLFVGDSEFVIIPGISEANYNGSGITSGTNMHTCQVSNVHNANLEYGTMTDQEGNVYKTIQLGGQEWMAENLKTSTYRNGDAIVTDLSNAEWAGASAGAWTFYNQEAANSCPFGKLYNWYAAVDERMLCPEGWHLPTTEEWSVLIDLLGGSNQSGGAMKTVGSIEGGTGFWYAPNVGATNSSGFSGLPGGYRTANGNFAEMGYNAYWWTATEVGTSLAWYRGLIEENAYTTGVYISKRSGFSIRCVQD
jgi:uncharacterized protein (TIGR02145 family)